MAENPQNSARKWKRAGACAILAGTLLLLGVCGRGERLDAEVANRLVGILVYKMQPTFHGDELARLSDELPQYRRFIDGYWLYGEGFSARGGLAMAYIRWRYDDEAFFLLRAGLTAGKLETLEKKNLIFEAALARDVGTFEQAWKSLASESKGVSKAALASLARGDIVQGSGQVLDDLAASEADGVNRAALESLARGDLGNGLAHALRDIERQGNFRERFSYRAYVARVLLKYARDPAVREWERHTFDAQLSEFLDDRGWGNFIARFGTDQEEYLHTILFDDMVSAMGCAAEYYAKAGDDLKREEWLKRLVELRDSLREKKKRQADWIDYLVQKANGAAASR